MHFGIIPINIEVSGLAQIIEIARLAESVGIESIWTAEHVMVPVDMASRYPYTETGKMPLDESADFYDPLVTLGAVASATSRIKLGTGINILPQANPLLLAKQAATLDALSGGRLILGLGLGWMREEFEAMGVSFERRGARFDDYLQAMRKVWSGELVQHHGDFVDWQGFKSLPTPTGKSSLPVLIGGHAGKALQRVARYGDGWYPAIYSPSELAPLLARLREVCQVEGRDFDGIEITAIWANTGGLDEIRRYRDLGVSRLTVPWQSLGQNPLEGIEWFADNIMAKLQE